MEQNPHPAITVFVSQLFLLCFSSDPPTDYELTVLLDILAAESYRNLYELCGSTGHVRWAWSLPGRGKEEIEAENKHNF